MCVARYFPDLVDFINADALGGWELINFVYVEGNYKAILVRSKGFNLCPNCGTAFETGVMLL